MDWRSLRVELVGDEPNNVLPPDIQLPMLPKAVMDFTARAEDPDASPRELGAIIETDAGLSCQLLRHVNSCAFGLKHKLSSCQHAISVLGVQKVKLFLATSAVREAMKASRSKLINFQNFWSTNLERAIFARELAPLLQADADLAFASAMLQDFLLPILTNEKLDAYLEFSQRVETESIDLIQFEKQTLGWDHAYAAACLMATWGFPDELVCCVGLHHGGLRMLMDDNLKRTAATATALAGLMPDPLQQTPQGLTQLQKLDSVWEPFKLFEIAERVEEQFQEASPSATNHISLHRRCQKLEKAELVEA